MKRDRNTFFTETGMNMNTNMMPNQMPYPNNYGVPFEQSAAFNSQIYSGPNNMYQTNNTELESRLSKMERQIHRLDARITKLENMYTTNFNATDSSSSNMYMI